MDIFLVGAVCGIAFTVMGLVIWNLQKPDVLDEVEAEIRKATPEYNDLKVKVRDRVRKARGKV